MELFLFMVAAASWKRWRNESALREEKLDMSCAALCDI